MKHENKKALIIGSCLALALLTLIVGANAETLDLEKNTCNYMPEINKDYCIAEYTVCDPSIDTKLIEIKYAEKDDEKTTKETDLKTTLPKLETEIKIELESGDCYKTEIKAWKSPLETIDHVLCYDDSCHLEYALWNGTFTYRIPFYGNVSSLESDTNGIIPVQIYIDGSKEVFWCDNVTVNQTNQTLFYIYYNDETDYICVDVDETSAITTIIDEGNSTDYGETETDLVLFDTMTSVLGNDVSRYNKTPITVNGNPALSTGKIGRSVYFDGAGDSFEYINDTINNAAGSVCMWHKAAAYNNAFESLTGCDDDEFLLYYYNAANLVNAINKDAFVVPVPDSMTWQHTCLVWNNTGVYNFLNGDLNAYDSQSSGVNDCSKYWIASWLDGTSSNRCMDVDVDNTMVFNRSLTGDEVKLIYYSQNSFFANGSAETNGTLPVPPVSNVTYNYTARFCENANYLHVIDKDLGDSGNAVYNEYLVYCQHGCTNESWTNLGNAACEESPIFLYALTIIIIIVCVAVGMKLLS